MIHPIELKRRVVAQYFAGDASYKSLSLEHGIPVSTIISWVQKVRAGQPFMLTEHHYGPVDHYGPVGPTRKPKSLFHFLAWKGGLRPDPELRVLFDTRNPFVPGLGKLIRKSGMSLDAARETCVEEGFLQDHECREHEPTINDLLELIAAEARGNKQYRIHEAVDALEFSRARYRYVEGLFLCPDCRAARARAQLRCVEGERENT
jgi:hypothetical protein